MRERAITITKRTPVIVGLLACAFALSTAAENVPDTGGITFRDVAANGRAGIDYRRVPSTTNSAYEALKHQPTYTFEDLLKTPHGARGIPGVALLDFDNDGALDIFVTNGPGAGNGLYKNLLPETGRSEFEDVAVRAGVALPNMDATGVCFGDINNDGHKDVYVLGRNEANRLFVNNGDGTFTEAGGAAGVGGGTFAHTSCSMGDINNDGLLDIAVANTFDWSNQLAIFIEPFRLNQPNQLFLNLGNIRFADVSDSSGFRNLSGLPAGVATITWAIAMVDIDLDGDVDIIHADDQGAFPSVKYGGTDRGLIHVLRNDGTGQFSDHVVNKVGAWMGLAFGDFNSDGWLDFVGTNFGDYGVTVLPLPYERGDLTSRWFLGRGGRAFDDPGVGDLRVSPFGWGVSALDYDNNGTTDVAYFGHIDVGFIIVADNPGVLLRNDGAARFSLEATPFASTNYNRLAIFGSAAGDLNNDGFDDLVTVSAMDIPDAVPLARFPVSMPPTGYGSPFDTTAYFVEQFSPVAPGTFQWNRDQFTNGTLQVQINSGDNGNGSVQVRMRGSVGTLPNGRVNRDGIGAVVTFTPDGGRSVMKPIVAGGSFASADSLLAGFGLGKAPRGTVEVLWPGGVRNRLYNVYHSERIVFPEIPCSFRAAWAGLPQYYSCVKTALDALVKRGVLDESSRTRFLFSALRAFAAERLRGLGVESDRDFVTRTAAESIASVLPRQ